VIRPTYVRWCGGTAAKAASYPISRKGTMRSVEVRSTEILMPFVSYFRLRQMLRWRSSPDCIALAFGREQWVKFAAGGNVSVLCTSKNLEGCGSLQMLRCYAPPRTPGIFGYKYYGATHLYSGIAAQYL
jgi:hypothetical protein